MLYLNPPPGTVSVIVKRKSRTRDKDKIINLAVCCSSAPLTEFMQTKDYCGYHMGLEAKKECPSINILFAIVSWTVSGNITGCKEFHHTIDQSHQCKSQLRQYPPGGMFDPRK